MSILMLTTLVNINETNKLKELLLVPITQSTQNILIFQYHSAIDGKVCEMFHLVSEPP